MSIAEDAAEKAFEVIQWDAHLARKLSDEITPVMLDLIEKVEKSKQAIEGDDAGDQLAELVDALRQSLGFIDSALACAEREERMFDAGDYASNFKAEARND